MKIQLLPQVILVALFALNAEAMLIHQIRFNKQAMFVSPDLSEARTDQNPDSSTVRVTLGDNPAEKRWELRFWNWGTGTRDLSSGLDITTGTDLYIRLQKFPKGHPQGVRAIYLDGIDLRDVKYSDSTDMIELNFRPMMPVVSASHSGGITAFAGVVFPYRGMPQDPGEITYAPPIITGNVVCSDLSKAQHPSSDLLRGTALRVNGIDGQRADFQFVLGSRYAMAKGFSLDQMEAYLDGMKPATGFGFGPITAPPFSINMGETTETFRIMPVFNQHFSARDIQVGVLPAPLRFTGINLETGGVRLFWNAEAGKNYAIEFFPALGSTPSPLGSNLSGPEFLDAQPPAANQARFYRLRTQ